MIEVWNNFAEQKKNQVAEYHLLKQPFRFQNNCITLSLTNPVEEQMLQSIKVDLLTYLRDKLSNGFIMLESEMQHQQTKKIAYTNKEKYEALVEKNPLLKTLQEKLGLDPEF